MNPDGCVDRLQREVRCARGGDRTYSGEWRFVYVFYFSFVFGGAICFVFFVVGVLKIFLLTSLQGGSKQWELLNLDLR